MNLNLAEPTSSRFNKKKGCKDDPKEKESAVPFHNLFYTNAKHVDAAGVSMEAFGGVS